MPGDPEDWRDALARHGPALVLFARQRCPCKADAEDAVQDGFVRFWRNRSRFRDPVPYLYACVRSAAIDLSRTNARRKKVDALRASPEVSSAFAPEKASERAELAVAIDAALARLPDEQREVLVMKIWGSLTFAQIAQGLAISPNTAASRYRYAIERLEAELAHEVRHD